MSKAEMENLDTPLKRLFCLECRRMVKPKYQIRLTPDECGQPTDVIVWDCANCGRENLTPDDVSILSAEIIEI
jgi:RNase P subunit RPR2